MLEGEKAKASPNGLDFNPVDFNPTQWVFSAFALCFRALLQLPRRVGGSAGNRAEGPLISTHLVALHPGHHES